MPFYLLKSFLYFCLIGIYVEYKVARLDRPFKKITGLVTILIKPVSPYDAIGFTENSNRYGPASNIAAFFTNQNWNAARIKFGRHLGQELMDYCGPVIGR